MLLNIFRGGFIIRRIADFKIFVLALCILMLSKSEKTPLYNNSPKHLFPTISTVDPSNEKRGLAFHRKPRRIAKRHITEPYIWFHQCYRRPTGNWSPELPVVFDCVPTSFFNISASTSTANGSATVNEIKGFTHSSPIEEESRTSTSSRNLERILVNASLQFDVEFDVTDLRLWYQGIIFVEDDAFIELAKLRLLTLQHNDISYLSRNAFSGLSTLEELDLSHNRLAAIQNSVFRNMTNLTSLNLRFNEIFYVQNSMFCGLRHLSILDLSHNMIEEIDNYALRHFRSSYTLTIDLTQNKLKTPKAEWLMIGGSTEYDDSCKLRNYRSVGGENKVVDIPSIPKFPENLDGMEITIRKTEDNNQIGAKTIDSGYVLPPVRMLIAPSNPWSCKCDNELYLMEFIRLYKSIYTAQFNGAGNVENSLLRFREPRTDSSKRIQFAINVTDPKIYANWYFNMPCSGKEFQGINLGRLTRKHRIRIEKTCCKKLSTSSFGRKVIANDDDLTEICKNGNATEYSQFTDNHVTIIGILIVFSTPILLTLCPDCNRSVSSSQRKNVVSSSGKFGAVSLNANNNKDHGFDQQSEHKPFDNERFCLVIQKEKPDIQKIYVSQDV